MGVIWQWECRRVLAHRHPILDQRDGPVPCHNNSGGGGGSGRTARQGCALASFHTAVLLLWKARPCSGVRAQQQRKITAAAADFGLKRRAAFSTCSAVCRACAAVRVAAANNWSGAVSKR